MGLLDGFFSDDPRQQAQLALAMGLLSGGGGKGFGGFARDLGRAGMGAQGVYNQASLLKDRRAEEEQQRKLRDMQMGQMQFQIDAQNRQREALSGMPDFTRPQLPDMAPTNDNAAALAAAPKPKPYEVMSKRAEYFSQKGLPELADKYYTQAEKLRPEVKEVRQIMQGDKPADLVIYKDGSHQVLPFGSAVKQELADFGGSKALFNPVTGKVGQQFGKTISPDTIYQGGVTMRGQDMTDRREGTQILDSPVTGPRVVNKRTGASIPVTEAGGRPVLGDKEATTQKNTGDVLYLLEQAKQIIPNATGSYVGAGVDLGARAFGAALPGDKATASLKAIEGSLLSKMPRMEGPQSNYDVDMYKQAAGRVGDPTIPRELKLEAIKTMEKIQKKYAGDKTPNGGWSIQRAD